MQWWDLFRGRSAGLLLAGRFLPIVNLGSWEPDEINDRGEATAHRQAQESGSARVGRAHNACLP
jgi:hypothetical protein